MGLFDGGEEPPHSKKFRYAITATSFIALVVVGGWYLFRFQAEKKTVENFMNALVSGQTEQAYKLWQAPATYSYKDFLDDWGPGGFYGPVRSYHLESAQHPKNGSGVVIVVEVSPDQPFPTGNDPVKNNRLKEVRLWVEAKDQSISFAP